MDPLARPLRNPDFVEEILEGEIVLYGAGAAQALYLNETASLVWQLVDGERSVAAISQLLAEAYPEAESADEDVRAVLQQLARLGVLQWP